MARRAARRVARRRSLLAAVRRTGRGAFVADTAPLVYRLERRAAPALTAACDPLFDAVEAGELACLVSSVSVAELFVVPFRAGPAAVSSLDGFMRQASFGTVAVEDDIARGAACLLAEGKLGRIADALIAAIALELGLPLVTNDRRIARAGLPHALAQRVHLTAAVAAAYLDSLRRSRANLGAVSAF